MLLLDQKGEQSIGGQAFWSLGGLFLINSVQQKPNGIKDGVFTGSSIRGEPVRHEARHWSHAHGGRERGDGASQ